MRQLMLDEIVADLQHFIKARSRHHPEGEEPKPMMHDQAEGVERLKMSIDRINI